MAWLDVWGEHGAVGEVSGKAPGTISVTSADHLHSWVQCVGADTLRAGHKLTFTIKQSEHGAGDR